MAALDLPPSRCRAAGRRRCRRRCPSSSSLAGTSRRRCTTVFWVSLEDRRSRRQLADLDDAALDAAGGDRAAALDREHVLDRHQERLVDLAHRLGDVAVERVEQILDALGRGRVLRAPGSAGERAAARRSASCRRGTRTWRAARAPPARRGRAGRGSSTRSTLFRKTHDVRHADLAGEQDVLARLRHRAVGGRDHAGSRRPSGPRR